MEQMEQLLPRNAKGHLYNSRRSEIFMGRGGRVNYTKFGQLILRKIIKIVATKSHILRL